MAHRKKTMNKKSHKKSHRTAHRTAHSSARKTRARRGGWRVPAEIFYF